jgi:hypothetical protein
VGAIQFVNPNKGIGFTFDNKIILTSDGGENWDQVNIPSNNYLNNIFAVDELNFWAVGDFGFIYHSTNGGQSWFSEINNNFEGRLFSAYFTDLDNGWIVGGNGLIVKYTNPMSHYDPVTNPGLVNTFHLYQNYPNPFNPGTKISYELPVTSFVTLKVYDVLGKDVALLVSERQSAGKYSVDFNARNLTSGVYFYKIEGGDFKEIKRMLLIK